EADLSTLARGRQGRVDDDRDQQRKSAVRDAEAAVLAGDGDGEDARLRGAAVERHLADALAQRKVLAAVGIVPAESAALPARPGVGRVCAAGKEGIDHRVAERVRE